MSNIILYIILAVIFLIALFLLIIFINLNNSNKRPKPNFNNLEKLNNPSFDYYREIPLQNDLTYFFYVAYQGNLIKEKDKPNLIKAYLLKWIKEKKIQVINQQSLKFITEFQANNPLEEELKNILLQACNFDKTLEPSKLQVHENETLELNLWFEKIFHYYDHYVITNSLASYQTKKDLVFDQITFNYSDEFINQINQIKGFKNFINEFSLINEKHLIELTLFEDYLIFATILNQANQVQKELKKMGNNFQISDLSNNNELIFLATTSLVLISFSSLLLGNSNKR